MASKSNKLKTNYYVSKIIEHASILDPFTALINWLELEEEFSKGSLTKEGLLNKADFRFINPERETIKIENIRNFNSELSYSGYTSAKRYIVFFNFESTTIPAQNAALKSIEEPPKDTQIILLTSAHNSILSTIISRCEVIYDSYKRKEQGDNETADLYTSICKSTHAEVIDIAANYKQRDESINISNRLLHHLHSELKNTASKYDKSKLAHDSKALLLLNQQLNQNCNVLLAVENCFFEFIA